MSKGKILVVDDEAVARVTLVKILQIEGYEVMAVDNGQEALFELTRQAYDVMILDIKMPGLSGMDVLRRVIDNHLDVRIILLTAFGSMDTALQALRSRVQDYLLKPISPLEILKSVRRALNEKSRMVTDEMIEAENARIAKATKSKVYKIGGEITVDCARRTIFWIEKTVQLTPTEARLLEALLESPNQVVSHVELVGRVQGYHVNPVDAAKILRPVMSRLRHKLEELPGGEDWIKNIRGSGYLLELSIVD